MKKKLTLSIDKTVLKSIKKKAKEQGWVISIKVENFFKKLIKRKI